MSYPGKFAATNPAKPAVVMHSTGETLTYAELEDRSIRLANALRERGLRRGDVIAVLAENHVRYLEIYWAAMRSGLYVTPLNWHLAVDEVVYQLTDSGAKALIATQRMGPVAKEAVDGVGECTVRLMIDGVAEGFESYVAALEDASARQTAPMPRGDAMIYSSGTTGRPKAIVKPLRDVDLSSPQSRGTSAMEESLFGMSAESVYLCPSPIYHSAGLMWSAGVHELGATLVLMEKFDPEQMLAAIEAHRVTHVMVVPTMLVRVLKTPPERRLKYDLSSLQRLIHCAAPCPPELKLQMIEWLGPIVDEWFGSTEGSGFSYITSTEWLAHRGSIGRPLVGTAHVCDDDGNEVPPGTPGLLWFELPVIPFEYKGDVEKTRASRHPEHPTWTSVGDVGYLDDDGYMYLTDRKSFMIISGGVNIYPAEIESCLVMHEAVADVAVFGVPDPEMGESVQAVVQPAAGVAGTPELAEELRSFVREHLAGYKVPRSVDFRSELPRLPTGKLAKGPLRDEYRQKVSG